MPALKRRRHQGHPHDVLHVAPYAKLEQYVRAVLAGNDACWIEGNATPFGMYIKLYRHRDQFVVIDDVDALYAERSGVRLLKCLCQTEEAKSVAWHTDARGLERQGVPKEFTTKSRVAFIANEWKTLD